MVSDDERSLLALPIRLSGLGIADPQTISDFEFAASEKVTSPLVGLILKQDMSFGCHVVDAQHLANDEVIASKCQAAEGRAVSVCDSSPSDLKRIISLLSEKGALSWLSALPVEEHGFALHKGAFRDALFLRYGWLPSGLPVHCLWPGFLHRSCFKLSNWGYPTLRHNELCDSTAEFLSEVCADVCTEPPLQALSGETLTYATANAEDVACLDIFAAGFWGSQHQKAFLMLKSSIRMPPAIGGHRFLLYTAGSRRINGGGMSRGFERLKWLLLHL